MKLLLGAALALVVIWLSSRREPEPTWTAWRDLERVDSV